MRRSWTRHVVTVVTLGLVAAACREPTQPAGTPMLSQAGAAGRYIVVFKPSVTDPAGLARRLASATGGTVGFTYRYAIKGFSATLPDQAVAAMRNNPNVAYVEPDAEVTLFGTQSNPPSWGLDRIDQTDLPLNQSYTYPNDGSTANIYILDTGVRLSHSDFGGRAQYVPGGANGNTLGNFVGDGQPNANDCHGHGTHVAGTAAGSSYGVAKGAKIWAARVVNCSGGGTVSMAIAAVDWVTANAALPAVVNMSLGYGNVQSLRDAVQNSIATRGVSYAVAAGNGNIVGIPQDACSESPAGAPDALTVGATDINDNEAYFSNFGTCVDLLGPGVSIKSAWHTGDNASNTISGTSMSTPHVAGAVALYLKANPGATPAQIASALVDNASRNKIGLHKSSRRGGTPNRLLNVSFIGGAPSNTPPVASFTYSCPALTCNFTDTSTDSDGTVVSWSWDFGDGGTSTDQHPARTYASAGTYTVTLTVTDNGGAQNATSQNVTVSAGGGFTLSASGFKVKGVQNVTLTWSGATSTQVDVYRDGGKIATTGNSGSYTDDTGNKGGGVTYVYKVCEAGTSTCSNEASATF